MAKDTKKKKVEPKKGKIVVVSDGGCITAVYCSDSNMEVDILDWDEVREEHGRNFDEDEILDEKTEGTSCIY